MIRSNMHEKLVSRGIEVFDFNSSMHEKLSPRGIEVFDFNSNIWRSVRARVNVVLMVCLATFLTACEKDMTDLQQYVMNVKSRPSQPIEPIPVIKPYVRFIYPGKGADPFDVSVLAPKRNKNLIGSVMIDKNRVPEYLENFALESLRMVGTVNKEQQLWALIRVPSGAVHRVKEGNYLGQNHGRILQVGDVSVKLTEIVENGYGGHKERNNKIAIATPNKK